MYRVGGVVVGPCKMVWPPKLHGDKARPFSFMRSLSYSAPPPTPPVGSFSKLKAFRRSLQERTVKMKPLLNEPATYGSQHQIQVDHKPVKKKPHANLLNKIFSLKNTAAAAGKNKSKNDCHNKTDNSACFTEKNYETLVDSVYIPLKDDTVIFQSGINENFLHFGSNGHVEDIIYIIQKDAGDGTIVLQSNGENFDIDPGVIDGIYIPLKDPSVTKNCTNNDDSIKDVNLKTRKNLLDTGNRKDVSPASCNLSVNGRQSVLSGYFTPDLTSPVAIRQYHTPSASPIMPSESCECRHNDNQINTDNDNNTVRVSGSNSVERVAEGTRPECCGCVYSVDKGISRTLDMTMKTSKEVMEKKVRDGVDLYPNCDTSIWMRTCEEEVVEPIQGVASGMYKISRIQNSLIRQK